MLVVFVRFSALNVIPGLRLGDQISCLHRVLAVADMTWHSVERLADTTVKHWRTENASFNDPQFTLHLAKAECFLLDPSKTEIGEVLAFLPSTPADCACLGDLADVSFGMFEPLGVRIAKVVWELGRFQSNHTIKMFESKCMLVVTGWLLLVVMLVVCVGDLGMAASYARHSASYHKNQHKAMHSRAALAVCLAS